MTPEEQQNAKKGVILAISAYTMWGIAPIYFKAISSVSALEILSHRVIWSFFLLAALLHFGRQWRSVVSVFRDKKKMVYLLTTALLVGGNWLILVVFGSVPIVAFSLAITFGLYGLLRKKVGVNAQTGLFIETLVLVPAAAIYLLWIADSATSSMLANDWHLNLLLISAGIVTTLPLLCFTGAATKLKLSTLGFFQYIGPSLMFLLAVLVYGENFSADKAITFAFIWSALVIFSVDGLTQGRKRSLANVVAK
jgi:chloramphenicol-sensitive protein RarD